MLLENIHIDNAIKFEHSETINSAVVDNNSVGATNVTGLRTLPFIPSNDNSIFVSKSGSDESNPIVSQIPLMIDATGINGVLTTNSEVAVGYEAWKAFDGDDSTYWQIVYTTGIYIYWLKYAFDVRTSLKYFTIKHPDITPDPYGVSWVRLYGSDDDVTYTELRSFQTSQVWLQNELRTYELNQSVKYKYYRIDLNIGATATPGKIGELKLYGEGSSIGTIEDPCLTVNEANRRCIEDQKDYIVIMDDGLYEESQINLSGTCKGIVSAIGKKPTIKTIDIPKQFDVNETDYQINVKEVFTADNTDAYYRYGVQTLLSNGNYAIVYMKHADSVTNENASHSVDWRCRIYNSSFTVILYDTILFTETGINHGFPIHNNPWNFIILKDRFVAFVGDSAGQTRLIINNDGSVYSQTELGYLSYHSTQHGVIKDNLWYFIEQLNGSAPSFTIYENNTLKYSITTTNYTSRYLGVDGDFTYFLQYSGTTYTYRKVNLITFAVDQTTVVSGVTTSPCGISNGCLFKMGNKFYVFSYGGGYYGFSEFNITTFTLTGQRMLFNSPATSTRLYPFIESQNSVIRNVYKLNETILLFVYGCNGDQHVGFGIIDVTKFDSSSSELSYDCVTGVSFVPVTAFESAYSSHYYNQLTPEYQISTRTPGHQLKIFDLAMIKSSVNSIINGIVFDADDKAYLKNTIKSTTSLDVQNSDFLNMYNEMNSINKFSNYVLKSTGAVVFKNNKIKDVSYGLEITANDVNFEKNIIFKSIDGNALKVIGSGTGIIINHNTFHNNFAGVELASNAGTEIIKNNIFYYNSSYGVKVATTLVVKNSCCPDILSVATLDSTSNQLNPLFKNNGFTNPDQVDVHLQSNYEGFTVNSPALAIGDDGKDAGCYDVTISVAPPTYTSFYLSKPKKITITPMPVGEIFNTMQDGSVDNRVDAFQLQVDLDFESLKAMYIKDLVKMIMAGGEIRIYFNPYTNASLFESYKLKYKDYPFVNALYSLSEFGYENIKLTFVRKFEKVELL